MSDETIERKIVLIWKNGQMETMVSNLSLIEVIAVLESAKLNAVQCWMDTREKKE